MAGDDHTATIPADLDASYIDDCIFGMKLARGQLVGPGDPHRLLDAVEQLQLLAQRRRDGRADHADNRALLAA